MHIWVITDNKAGNKTQAIALANAISDTISGNKNKTIQIIDQTIECAIPWRYLPLSLWGKSTYGIADTSFIPKKQNDYPDIIVSCGRQGAGVARAIKHNSRGKTFAIHIQNPRIAPDNFDVIVAPHHDNITGNNIIVSNGAISRFNRADLDIVKRQSLKTYASLPKPIIAVSLGGNNKAYKMTSDWIENTGNQLLNIAHTTGGSLLISPSRRTGDDNIKHLKEKLADINGIFWDGTGHNPYTEFLAHADAHIVTCESVNMISDCIMTERPVYILDLPLRKSIIDKSKKFKTFVSGIIDKKLAFPLNNDIMPTLDKVSFKPENETKTIASDIVNRFKKT